MFGRLVKYIATRRRVYQKSHLLMRLFLGPWLDRIDEEFRKLYSDELAAIRREQSLATVLVSEAAMALRADFDASMGLPAQSSGGFSGRVRLGIIGDGRRPEKLEMLLRSIERQVHPEGGVTLQLVYSGKLPEEGSPVARAFERLGQQGLAVRLIDNEAAAAGSLRGVLRNALIDVPEMAAGPEDYLVTLDDDMLLHSRFLERLVPQLGGFEAGVAVILNPDLTRFWDWASIRPLQRVRPYWQTPQEEQYMTGGVAVFRMSLFDQVRWDETMTAEEDRVLAAHIVASEVPMTFLAGCITMHNDDRYSLWNGEVGLHDEVNRTSLFRSVRVLPEGADLPPRADLPPQ